MNWFGATLHLASPRLTDLSVPKEFYEFHLPSPPPDPFFLQDSLEFDPELARELFVPEPSREDDG
ncbi:MAG: hypothetical protein R6U37_05160 [Dehalococcoidia bacterium]